MHTQSFLLCFASLAAAFSTIARADTYYPSYNNYSNYSSNYSNSYYSNSYRNYGGSQHAGPMLSLELDPQKNLDESMRVASREERLQEVTDFITRGANVNSASETGETALMYASRSCSIPVVNALLRHHAKINQRDSYGRTALMYAVSETCLPVVRLLLELPATNVALRDEQKMSALDYAKEQAETDVDGPAITIVKLLEEVHVTKAR